MSDEHSLRHRDALDMTTSEANAGRGVYRLTVHRIAHARLRDELATGLCGTVAAWVALRETTANCSLTTPEAALLLRSLLAAAGHTDL
ncbi:MAG: hypothetical protein M3Y58_05295 [Chloroflexota bacterium]|nr:hypothetical protein [Chloroflexota bacterium]